MKRKAVRVFLTAADVLSVTNATSRYNNILSRLYVRIIGICAFGVEGWNYMRAVMHMRAVHRTDVLFCTSVCACTLRDDVLISPQEQRLIISRGQDGP